MSRSARRRVCLAVAVAALATGIAAPAHGAYRYGSPDAAVPVPPPPSSDGTERLFGFNGRPRGEQRTADYVRTLAASGAQVARFSVQWALYEPRAGSYLRDGGDDTPQWRWLNGFVDALHRHGITPMLVVGDAPRWAQVPGECDAGRLFGLPCSLDHLPAPEHVDAAYRFTRHLVRHVKRRLGGAPVFVEAVNEPNRTMKPSPAVYADRYFDVAKAIHDGARNGGADRILLGGLAPTSRSRATSMAMPTLMEELYRRGLKRLMPDIEMNVHIYPGRADWDRTSAWHAQWALVELTMARHGDLGRPVWLTEFGATTTGPVRVSEPEQERIVLGTYSAAFGRSPLRVVGALVHTLTDDPTASVTDHEHGFGLLDDAWPFRARPAWCALLDRQRRARNWEGCPRRSVTGRRSSLRRKSSRPRVRRCSKQPTSRRRGEEVRRQRTSSSRQIARYSRKVRCRRAPRKVAKVSTMSKRTSQAASAAGARTSRQRPASNRR